MKHDDISAMSYNQALDELEKILEKLRSDACDVDSLTSLTGRAALLLNHCRSRLTTTESNLQQILQSLLPEAEND